MCVCCNTAPKVSDCPQPNSHNLFWVLPELVMDQSYAVCMLYMYCIKVIEYHWITPNIPLDYSFSILPVLSYRNSFCSIQSLKSKSTVKKLRNFLSYWLICSCVCAVCVCVCLPRCLRRPYLYHLLFLTDLKCLGKRFFEAMSLFRAARRQHLSTSSTWPKTPWLKRLQITT